MKNARIVILYYKLSFLILFLLLKSALLLATEDVIYNLKFKQLSAPYSLPTNEVQKVYQDKDGFIWFATRNGLCQYNGYETTLYKSNLYFSGSFIHHVQSFRCTNPKMIIIIINQTSDAIGSQ